MKTPMKTHLVLLTLGLCVPLFSQEPAIPASAGKDAKDEFQVVADRFADIEILRYRAPEFDQLSLRQKKLAYFLTQAGFEGRDIFYDQKNKHGILIRKTIETILRSYGGDKNADEFKKFVTYAKRFFFANGMHHHYSAAKFVPECSPQFFAELLRKSDRFRLPLEGKSVAEFSRYITPLIFDPKVDPKLIDLSPDIDNVRASAVNFYEGVTEDEVNAYYQNVKARSANKLLSFGLNSKVVKQNGQVRERKWMVGGMYDPAIRKMIGWLEKAIEVAENDQQKKHLRELIEFYRTGDLQHFDQYCIDWVKETSARIDVVNGFIEVYQDPLQMKGSFESVVSMKDLEASKRIAAISEQAQWFEDHSSILPEHKKKNVVGISAKVITVLGETGDSAPATPVGINLPNPNWIREKHGSKSVMLGNIMEAYNYVKAKSPATEEFSATPEIAARVKEHGALASILHVDMHEVIGHASGRINDGVETPDKTLQTYAGTLEEGRADLVALYFAMEPKLVEIGVMPSIDVGKAEYDQYITAGLLTQLYRIQPGEDIEESHMRNRQLIAAWAFEKGKDDNVIERITRDGKTYFKVNHYEKLRDLFGELLREIQRIKSEGDYEAGKHLVETHGVKADQKLLAEVHQRYERLNIAPYQGFIQPRLEPVTRDGEITDVKIEYPNDFLAQMLEYGEKYANLPVRN
jgi:dipeptidyl-peptidase-3